MLRRGHPEFVVVKKRRPTLTLKGFRADPAENATKQTAGGAEQGEQAGPAPRPGAAETNVPPPSPAAPAPAAQERRGIWGSLGVDMGRLFAEAEERFGSVEPKPKVERPVPGPFVRPVAKPTSVPVAQEAAAAPPMETVPHAETPEVHGVSPVTGMTPGEIRAVAPEASVMPQTSEAPEPVAEAPVETTLDPVEAGQVEARRDAGDVSPQAPSSEEPPLFPDLPALKVPGTRPARKEVPKAAGLRSRTAKPATAQPAPARVAPAQTPVPLRTPEPSPADAVAENFPAPAANLPAAEEPGSRSLPAEMIEWMNAIAALERRRSEIMRDMMRERRNYARRRGELVNALSLAMTELGAPRARAGDHRKRA